MPYVQPSLLLQKCSFDPNRKFKVNNGVDLTLKNLYMRKTRLSFVFFLLSLGFTTSVESFEISMFRTFNEKNIKFTTSISNSCWICFLHIFFSPVFCKYIFDTYLNSVYCVSIQFCPKNICRIYFSNWNYFFQIPRLISSMPYVMRYELMNEIYGQHLSASYIFSGTEEAFIRQLTVLLKHVVLFPGNYIVQHGDSDQCMYFIHRGEVSFITPSNYTGCPWRDRHTRHHRFFNENRG